MDDNDKKRSKKRLWPWIGAGVILLFGLWQLVTHPYVEEEKALRSQVRKTVMENFPELVEKFSQTIGLFPYSKDRKPVGEDLNRNTVVLIHGLDDPGKVWQNLAPQLAQTGADVWLMNYPNDQPIVESTLLFLEELKILRQQGTYRISIVAHSMGGLISRELLTSPVIDYSNLAKQNEMLVPQVERLIMVGTPNHGSQMARFRIFSEVRDQIDRLFEGQSNGLGFILDGAGEAKIDLLPGSRFLTELNKRPAPEGVDMLVIAGISTPWSDDDINNMLSDIGQKVGGDRAQDLQKIGSFMKSMANGLGDGLVTLESALLPGVPYLTVSGTHLSMIRNISFESKRVPPAVPIIVKLLNKKD